MLRRDFVLHRDAQYPHQSNGPVMKDRDRRLGAPQPEGLFMFALGGMICRWIPEGQILALT
jgi:hypothetical protein